MIDFLKDCLHQLPWCSKWSVHFAVARLDLMVSSQVIAQNMLGYKTKKQKNKKSQNIINNKQKQWLTTKCWSANRYAGASTVKYLKPREIREPVLLPTMQPWISPTARCVWLRFHSYLVALKNSELVQKTTKKAATARLHLHALLRLPANR